MWSLHPYHPQSYQATFPSQRGGFMKQDLLLHIHINENDFRILIFPVMLKSQTKFKLFIYVTIMLNVHMVCCKLVTLSFVNIFSCNEHNSRIKQELTRLKDMKGSTMFLLSSEHSGQSASNIQVILPFYQLEFYLVWIYITYHIL